MTSTPLVGNTFFGLDISQLGSKLMSVRRRLSKRLLLLEFSSSGLRYAEASPSLDGIRLTNLDLMVAPCIEHYFNSSVLYLLTRLD